MGWYEALKDALTAANRLEDAEMHRKLTTVQMECAALAEENARLREERNALHEQLRRRMAMHYDHNVYWEEVEPGKRVGPYCPKCWDGDGKGSRMEDRHDDICWRCRVCGTVTEKPGSHARQRFAVTDDDPSY